MSYPCKILAIDGGGIRGIIPAYILQQLEAALGKPIYQSFDVIAGTSTGGLIAMALTTPLATNNNLPMSASAILDLYLNDESKLFVLQTGDVGAKYNSIALWLQSVLGLQTLSQAQQALASGGGPVPRQVLATCYTLNGATGVNIGPYLFNWQAAANSPADDYCVWEATLGTSSAPTYFPLGQVGAGVANGSNAASRWVADGGIAANNPALYALAWACQNMTADLNNVLIVSLGTGLYNPGIEILGGGNWGKVEWTAGFDTNGNLTEPLINVLATSNVLSPDQQLQRIMPSGGYYRLEPVLPYGESTLDGTDTQTLLSTAEAFIGTHPEGPGAATYQSVLTALGVS
jgi:hypothetical protein